MEDTPMSNYTTHSSLSDRWTKPRPYLDPSNRRRIHGPLRPMEEPSFFERLFRGS
jgi:hypothetical protein